jgi:hypothetical protein
MTYYIVMDAWNVVVSRFADAAEAALCARKNNGHIVIINRKAA